MSAHGEKQGEKARETIGAWVGGEEGFAEKVTSSIRASEGDLQPVNR